MLSTAIVLMQIDCRCSVASTDNVLIEIDLLMQIERLDIDAVHRYCPKAVRTSV